MLAGPHGHGERAHEADERPARALRPHEGGAGVLSECQTARENCGAERERGAQGRCRSGIPVPARPGAAAQFGEEPCISGTRGSGTIFFTGCPRLRLLPEP